MNLFIMSPEEIIQWYKPQNEPEQYLVDKLKETIDNFNYLEQLYEEELEA